MPSHTHFKLLVLVFSSVLTSFELGDRDRDLCLFSSSLFFFTYITDSLLLKSTDT